MLDEGAGEMTSQAFQAREEALAMRMSFSAGQDWFSGSFKTLTKNRDASFAMLKLALNAPRFDAKPLERVRRQLLVSIRSKSQNPDHIAYKAFKKLLFGDHPYARDADGSEAGVKAVTADDLRALRKKLFARSGLLVTVSGDIDAKTLSRLLDDVFGGLAEKSAMPETPAPVITDKAETKIISRPIPQTIIFTGGKGLLRSDPDFIPAYIANFILGGGGFGSRLTEEVREKRGLTYSVYSAMFSYRKAGVFFANAGTRNEKAAEALKIIHQQIARMAAEGPTEKELEEAKTYLIGSYPLRYDSNVKIAANLLAIRRDNLGIDYIRKRTAMIRAVTLEQVKKAARRILRADAMKTVLLGQPVGVKVE
jgi:zinc protease